jgi:hypothetical protein
MRRKTNENKRKQPTKERRNTRTLYDNDPVLFWGIWNAEHSKMKLCLLVVPGSSVSDGFNTASLLNLACNVGVIVN